MLQIYESNCLFMAKLVFLINAFKDRLPPSNILMNFRIYNSNDKAFRKRLCGSSLNGDLCFDMEICVSKSRLLVLVC